MEQAVDVEADDVGDASDDAVGDARQHLGLEHDLLAVADDGLRQLALGHHHQVVALPQPRHLGRHQHAAVEVELLLADAHLVASHRVDDAGGALVEELARVVGEDAPQRLLEPVLEHVADDGEQEEVEARLRVAGLREEAHAQREGHGAAGRQREEHLFPGLARRAALHLEEEDVHAVLLQEAQPVRVLLVVALNGEHRGQVRRPPVLLVGDHHLHELAAQRDVHARARHLLHLHDDPAEELLHLQAQELVHQAQRRGSAITQVVLRDQLRAARPVAAQHVLRGVNGPVRELLQVLGRVGGRAVGVLGPAEQVRALLLHAPREAPERAAHHAGQHLRVVDDLARGAHEAQLQPLLELHQRRVRAADDLVEGQHRRLEPHVVVEVGVELLARPGVGADVEALRQEEDGLDQVLGLWIGARGLVLELQLELLSVVDLDLGIEEFAGSGGNHSRHSM